MNSSVVGKLNCTQCSLSLKGFQIWKSLDRKFQTCIELKPSMGMGLCVLLLTFMNVVFTMNYGYNNPHLLVCVSLYYR